jgi:hypothetical protein
MRCFGNCENALKQPNDGLPRSNSDWPARHVWNRSFWLEAERMENRGSEVVGSDGRVLDIRPLGVAGAPGASALDTTTRQ